MVRRRALLTLALTLLLLPAAAALTACEDQALGRRCALGTDAIDPGIATFNSQALECPSRICLQVAQASGATGSPEPQCTAECKGDGDCSGGENCEGGFACVVAQTTGPFCCRKVCACRDFVFIPDGGLENPEACDPATSLCPNVQ